MLQGLTADIANFMPQAISAGTMVSSATIQKPDKTQGPTGNYVGTYTNLAGAVNIECQNAPPSMARIQATEVKAVSEILSKGLRHVLLSKCFPDAPADPTKTGQKGWSALGYRCIVGTIIYDILGAEIDSQSTQTRLELQLATV